MKKKILKLCSIALFFNFSSGYAQQNVNTHNPMPEYLCVDAQDYWDGPVTVEISRPDELGKISAQLFAQTQEGRILISSVHVEKSLSGTQLKFEGHKFLLDISLESFAPTKKHSARLEFSNENGSVFGDYICLDMK